MEAMFSGEAFVAWLHAGLAWLLRDVLTSANIVYTAMQVPAVVSSGFAAWWVHDFVHPMLERRIRRSMAPGHAQAILLILASLIFPTLWALGLWVQRNVAVAYGWPHDVVRIAINLVVAWIVVRLALIPVRDPIWSRLIAILAYAAAVLNVLHLLDPTLRLLGRIAITMGNFRLSILMVMEGVILLGLLLWAAMLASKMLERQVSQLPNLTPSIRVLLGKLLKATLITLAVLVALTSVGIDLTAVALFSGALGLGLGFGLQKIVSNMISGMILLLDKSIKPGDVIQVGATYGWVTSMGTRYVSIETRDGPAFLVPNEDIITHQVVNWTHRSDLTRLKVRIQVPFDSDLDLALALLVQAADKPPRVVKEPTPRALVLEFEDGRAVLELRFWIRDAQNGIRNVSGEVQLEIWRLFRAHRLSLAAPKRDITVSPPPAEPASSGAPSAALPPRAPATAILRPEPASP